MGRRLQKGAPTYLVLNPNSLGATICGWPQNNVNPEIQNNRSIWVIKIWWRGWKVLWGMLKKDVEF